MTTDSDLMCPSWTCEEGAVVIGVLGPGRRLGYLRTAVRVDAKTRAEFRRRGDPLERIRFAATCIRDGCEQWAESRCTLIDRLLQASFPESETPADLPRCAIRATCRWFAQHGRDACATCRFVTYNPPASRPE